MPAGGSPAPSREGVLLKRSSNTAWVDIGEEVLACSLRGKLRGLEPCVAGDRVRVTPAGPGVGALEEVLPRRSVLQRGKESARGEGRVVAANLDQVAVVISAAEPPPRWALVDRLLVEADRQGLGALVVVNKLDLAGKAEERRALDEAVEVYRSIGYRVLPVSAQSGAGLAELESALSGLLTVLSGHSGVGKSTLLNRLVPGASLVTREVNPKTKKGLHTTTSAVLVKLPVGGYVTDTPGFREFALAALPAPELGRRYPEFQEAIAACRFKDCLHEDDAGCAVRAAAEAGRISKLRYQNYLQVLRSLLEKS
jgi:ribosome biogenesis GTPase